MPTAFYLPCLEGLSVVVDVRSGALSESIMSIPQHVLDLRYQLSPQDMLLGPRYELWKIPDNLEILLPRHGVNHSDHTGGIAKKRCDDAIQLTSR